MGWIRFRAENAEERAIANEKWNTLLDSLVRHMCTTTNTTTSTSTSSCGKA